MKVNEYEIKPGADLQHADLRHAGLQGANLQGAYLRYADLQGADLRYADLQGADLRRADLRHAELRYAALRHADLRYADLQGADLQGANLQGANLNWHSHELLGEVLRQAAGQDMKKRAVAGIVALSLDWCWDRFVKEFNDDQKQFAREALKPWWSEDDKAPAILRGDD